MIASGPGAAVRFPVPPCKSLAIEFLQSGKRTGGKEGFPYIPNDSLNAPLLIAGTHLARAGGKMIMGAQFQESGMKMNGIPMPLQHDTAKIVVEQDSGKALPVFKGMDVTAQKTFHALVEEELKVQCPGIGKRDHKTGKPAACAANGNFSKMRPVHLSLFCQERCVRRRNASLWAGRMRADESPQLARRCR